MGACTKSGSRSSNDGGNASDSTAATLGSTDSESASSGGSSASDCPDDTLAPDEELSVSADPTAGVFELDDALAALPEGPGPLRARIDTPVGSLTCDLRPDKAPRAVANFVGLARGLRPWKDPKSGKWVKRRFYDGLLFHRVIPKFMAQGGDPLGTGYGGPGYQFKDEISDLHHEPGALAYANAGPDTNGSQFYVAEVKLKSLDGGYTIFGNCAPVSVVQALTTVPTGKNDKPKTPLPMTKVVITRCAP